MLISRGVLNLAHRNSHAHPELLVPGIRYSVSLPLKGLCRTIRKVRTALKAPFVARMYADAEGQSTSSFCVDVVLAVGVAVCTARPHYVVRSVLSCSPVVRRPIAHSRCSRSHTAARSGMRSASLCHMSILLSCVASSNGRVWRTESSRTARRDASMLTVPVSALSCQTRPIGAASSPEMVSPSLH